MSHRLLFFNPSSSRQIENRNPHPQSPVIRYPGFEVQQRRLPVVFRELQNAVEGHRLHSRVDVQGVDPEFVLVFEVAGSVDNFNKALVRAGMEWLCTSDEESACDEDFYSINQNGERVDKPITQKVYITMSNQQALQNLLSLWNDYVNSQNHKLRFGYGAFVKVFEQLRTVRKWGAQDRMREDVIEVWTNLLERNPESIRLEIELWYRDTEAKRQESVSQITEIVNAVGGRVIRCVHYEEIRYHAMVVQLPSDEIREMIAVGNTDLLNSNQVMWFRATGQTIAKVNETEPIEDVPVDNQLPQNAPIIALLDGLPLANHTLLANRLSIYDPDNFEDGYHAASRLHGSAMASLIIFGDRNAPNVQPLSSRLYVRPIMKSIAGQDERVPDDELFVDLLHRAVIDIVNQPESSGIKIINLSIGSLDRPYLLTMSPESRMLDYLSEKYNLLFVVSSGNADIWIDNGATADEYKRMSLEERASLAYSDLWNNRADHQILAPSESINALTIGAQHADYTNVQENDMLFNPLPDGFPALYSRFGGGVNRSNKPDAIVPGGKTYMVSRSFGSFVVNLSKANERITGPGQKVVSPVSPTHTAHLVGTSNSAALTSRMCGQLLENLRQMHPIPSDYEAIAAKCMFIHACTWGDLGQKLMENHVPADGRHSRDNTSRWIGYGYPILERSLFNEDYRVTILGYGSIESGRFVEFRFPLPPCLQAQNVEKKLTITLAWNSPIDVRHKKYRLAALEFKAKPEDARLLPNGRTESSNNSSKRGTVQHEVFMGSTASTFQDGDDLVVTVQCAKEDKLTAPIKFVLMATLEVAADINLNLFQEVQARLQSSIQVY